MDSPRELELVQLQSLRRLREGQYKDAVLVLWLRSSSSNNQRAETLLDRLREEGMEIDKSSTHDLSKVSLDAYDLILISVTHVEYGRIDELLGAIRRISRAPIVLLTEQYSLDWFVSAVRAGADAAADAHTPDEVLLAHCRALLRRWRSSP
jgi:DNA-binding response OmpR family regulator